MGTEAASVTSVARLHRQWVRRRELLLTLLVAAALAPTGALAFNLGDLLGGAGGTIVYDPSNHLETAVSAAQSVRQTALQVRAEIQRLEQLRVELEQLKALPEDTVRAVLADWRAQLGALQEAGAAVQGLATELARVRERSAARLREIASLGLSPSTYLQREMAAASLRGQTQATLFAADRQSLAVITRTARSLALLQAQIPASRGIQQSMQTTNQYLDLLAGQTGQLLQLTAAQAASQSAQQQERENDGALADARESERLAGDLQRITRLRDDLRNAEARQGLGLLPPLP